MLTPAQIATANAGSAAAAAAANAKTAALPTSGSGLINQNGVPTVYGQQSGPIPNSTNPTGSTTSNNNLQSNTPTTFTGQNGVVYNNSNGLPVSQSPVMTANFANPVSYGTNPAPAIISSKAATDHLNNVGTQISNINQDAQNQAQSNTANAQSNTQSNQGSSTDTSGSNTNDTTTPTDAGDQLSAQINNILANLGQGESDLNNELNNATTANNEGQQVSYADAQAENQFQQVQEYQQYAGLLNQIQSGTYPLSAPEQQLLSSTQSQFLQAIQAQQTANQAYSGQMAEAMASLGINTSAPTEAMGNIYGAISTGQSKIADLDTQMAQSLSNLQLGFQKQDFDQVQSEWDNMSKQFEDRQSTLSDLQKQTADAVQQQKTDMQQYATQTISAITDSANFSYKEKQDQIDNAFKSQQLDETAKKDASDTLIAQMNAQKGQYTQTSTGQIMNTRTGQITGQATADASQNAGVIGNTGNPLVDANTTKTANGIPYVNGTNLTGAQGAQAQLTAAQNGIPYLGAAAASAMQQSSSVRNSLTGIEQQLQAFQSNDFANRPLNSLLNNANAATQASSILASFGTFQTIAIPLLKSLAGGTSGFRITQAEINNVTQNDIPSPNDTVATAQQKINNIQSLLDNGERGLFGDQTYDKFNPAASANDLSSYVSANPDVADKVTQMRTAGYSPYTILQAFGAPMGVSQAPTNADSDTTTSTRPHFGFI